VNSHSRKASVKLSIELSTAFLNHLSLTVGRVLDNSTPLEQYHAICSSVYRLFFIVSSLA
jgi:hypothetical protein